MGAWNDLQNIKQFNLLYYHKLSMYLIELLNFKLPNYIFYASCLITITILATFRFNSKTNTKDYGDALGQYFLATISIFDQSVSPKLKNWNNEIGHLHYPRGFYWLSANSNLIKNIGRKLFKKNSIQIIANELPMSDIDRIDSAIVGIKFLSGLLFPVASNIIILLITITADKTLLTLLFSITALLINDSVYTNTDYSVSTRNVGQFGYSIFAFCLIYCLPHFTENSNNSASALILLGLSLAISIFICFLCSQRGSQALIALMIACGLLVNNLAVLLGVVLAITIIGINQFPNLNIVEIIKTHFYNRIHEQEWSLRHYGRSRYKLFDYLKGNFRKDFLLDFARFKYLSNNMISSAYFKYNFLSIFCVHRIYIYSLIILIFSYFTEGPSMIPTQIIIAATLVPSLLSFFRPFQGYGASEVYVWSNLPILYATLIFNSSNILTLLNTQHPLMFLVKGLMFVDLVFLIVFGNFYIAKKLINVFYKYKSQDKDLVCSLPPSCDLNDFNNLANFISNILPNKIPENKRVSIVPLESHWFYPIESLCLFAKRTHGNDKVQVAVKLIDNQDYGYYQDSIGFNLKPDIIINIIKPNLLMLDLTKPLCQAFANKNIQESDKRIIFRSGPLILFALR